MEYFVETHLCKLCVILRSRLYRYLLIHQVPSYRYRYRYARYLTTGRIQSGILLNTANQVSSGTRYLVGLNVYPLGAQIQPPKTKQHYVQVPEVSSSCAPVVHLLPLHSGHTPYPNQQPGLLCCVADVQSIVIFFFCIFSRYVLPKELIPYGRSMFDVSFFASSNSSGQSSRGCVGARTLKYRGSGLEF